MRKYEVTINEKDYSVLVKKFSPDDAELEINGKTYSIKMDGPIKTISSNGQMFGSVSAPPPQAASTAGSGDAVTAPIPGSVLEILVKEGDKVEAGQTVVKMEAMKMENEINAPVAGTISSILVSVGDAVNQGQKLVEIG